METIQHASLSSEGGQVWENGNQRGWPLPPIVDLDKQPNTASRVEGVYMLAFAPLTGQQGEGGDMWSLPESDNNDLVRPQEVQPTDVMMREHSTREAPLPQPTGREECESLFRYGACSSTLIAKFFNTQRGWALNYRTVSVWFKRRGAQPSVDDSTCDGTSQLFLKYLDFLYEQRKHSNSSTMRAIELEIERIETSDIAPVINTSKYFQVGPTSLRGRAKVLSEYGGARSRTLIFKFLKTVTIGWNCEIIKEWQKWGLQIPASRLVYEVKRWLILDYYGFLVKRWHHPKARHASRTAVWKEMARVVQHIPHIDELCNNAL